MGWVTVDEESFLDQIIMGDMPSNVPALDHMARVASSVYLPLITNPSNQVGPSRPRAARCVYSAPLPALRP